MRKISKATKILGIFIKFFIIFLLSAIIILKYGIKIDKLKFADVNFEQLYIKLDKKLIVKAQNITLLTPKDIKDDTTSSKYLLNLSQNAIWLDRLFQEISLKNLQIGENIIEILFKDEIFYIDSAYLMLDIRIGEKIDEKTEKIEIKNMSFKDFNISVSGNASANLRDKKYAFSGKFKSYELSGNVEFAIIGEQLRYKAHNVNAKSLKSFMQALDKQVGLDKEVKNWIYGYIIAKDYTLNEISGKVNLKTNDFFLNDLRATANAKNLSITLNKSLEPILVKEANITLSDAKLSFALKDPTYHERSLDGSSLYIYNIFGENNGNSGIFLDLKTNSLYDNAINAILKVYDIDVPITQNSGNMDARLTLDINFNTLEVIANGNFIATNAKFNIANAPFSAKKAVITLKNSFDMYIDAENFGMEFFNSNASAKFDLKNGIANINGKLKEFSINTKDESILYLENENFNAVLDFSKDDTMLEFYELGLALKFGKTNAIGVKKPLNFIPNSKLLTKLNIKDAKNIDIKTRDFDNFDIVASGVKFDMPLLNKDGLKYEIDDFKIALKANEISGESESKKLKFYTNNDSINIEIKSVDINLSLDDTNSTSNQKIEIKGANSNILITDTNQTLILPNYHVFIHKDSIKFSSNVDGGRINFSKNKTQTSLEARDISGEYINQFINKQSFSEGKFKLKVVGDDSGYKGEVRFYDTFFKDYTFYQRLLSFINSVPSLLSLKTPDFNSKGFSAKSGKILFEKHGDILKFIAIEIMGTSADIVGAGDINLKNGKINIDLELEILKDASNIIDKIPLLNHIILGKDRTFTTLIRVRGTLDEPEYSTQVIQDTLLTPFKLIRNVLQAPFLIFD